MKIALVWKNDYPWDVRVEKFCKTLISFGHEVHIIARNLKRGKTEENSGGIIIHRIEPRNGNFLNTVTSIPAFFNPVWFATIHSVCKKNNIHLIIVRDLPLVVTGVIVGRRLAIPVVFDMAELYSAMWADLNRIGGFRPLNYILKNPLVGRYLERYSINSVDHTFVVIDEAKKALLELGADEKRVSIVSNTPDINEMEKLKMAGEEKRWEGRTVLFYHGYINVGRGLEAVIRSMPQLIKKFKDLLLVLIGTGEGFEPFKDLCQELNVEKNIEFVGWLDFHQIPSMINEASICIIPHLATEHKNTTIPNKLFDYMACGKPVVVADAKPLKRIVEEERCGLVFESGSSESFIRIVTQMLQNPSLAQNMGENGYRAVKRRYNWEYDSRVLKHVIEDLKKKTRVTS